MKTKATNFKPAPTAWYVTTVQPKRTIETTISIILLIFLALLGIFIGLSGCKKSPGATTSYKQVNLVSDTAAYNAERIDPQLVNPWGIAVNVNNGAFWLADNGTGLSSVYNSTGTQLLPAVTVPAPGSPTGGAASGAVYNGTTDFGANPFIYCTEDGTILIWKSGTTFSIAVDSSSANAVFKGLALANDGTGNFLFVADFHNNKVDVFNNTFAPLTGRAFTDPNPISGFAPFNIGAINGQLYIVYAKQDAMQHDDVAGPGNGYVDIFSYSGTFVKRFTTQGTLNSPWAIIPSQTGFGPATGDILVGNFGDGTINVFDAGGNFQSQLKDNTGKVISIGGLWGLATLATSANQLFFTAGPAGENHGVFGYVQTN